MYHQLAISIYIFPSIILSIPNGLSRCRHFGVDSIAEYTGKEFEVTFEEGVLDLYRVYTKCIKKDGKNRVRADRQEYPNQEYADAIVKKLFPNGHLMNIESSTAMEERT
jgi:hypothetical protein